MSKEKQKCPIFPFQYPIQYPKLLRVPTLPSLPSGVKLGKSKREGGGKNAWHKKVKKNFCLAQNARTANTVASSSSKRPKLKPNLQQLAVWLLLFYFLYFICSISLPLSIRCSCASLLIRWRHHSCGQNLSSLFLPSHFLELQPPPLYSPVFTTPFSSSPYQGIFTAMCLPSLHSTSLNF